MAVVPWSNVKKYGFSIKKLSSTSTITALYLIIIWFIINLVVSVGELIDLKKKGKKNSTNKQTIGMPLLQSS